jgi:hypothetical protein
MRKTLAIAVAAVALTLGGACTQRPVGERPLRRVRFRRSGTATCRSACSRPAHGSLIGSATILVASSRIVAVGGWAYGRLVDGPLR